jgi:hypothetical protein
MPPGVSGVAVRFTQATEARPRFGALITGAWQKNKERVPTADAGKSAFSTIP